MHRLRMIEADGDLCRIYAEKENTHIENTGAQNIPTMEALRAARHLHGEIVVASADTLAHIGALRLRDGEEVEIVNFESGTIYHARYSPGANDTAPEMPDSKAEDAGNKDYAKTRKSSKAKADKRNAKNRRQARFVVLKEESLLPDSPVVHLFQARSKQAKHEFVAQKAVEAGVHEIILFESDFSEKGGELKITRLEKIASEAALQSKSPVLPPIRLCSRLETVDFSDYDKVLFFYEHGEEKVCIRPEEAKTCSGSPKIAVIIGSEGGFSEEEAEWAKNAFGGAYSLGNRILRTETAALAAIIIVKHEMGKSAVHQ